MKTVILIAGLWITQAIAGELFIDPALWLITFGICLATDIFGFLKKYDLI